jgi:hypothetical protein
VASGDPVAFPLDAVPRGERFDGEEEEEGD